jgi:hypothetical protein
VGDFFLGGVLVVCSWGELRWGRKEGEIGEERVVREGIY